jgi:hypothetical protein
MSEALRGVCISTAELHALMRAQRAAVAGVVLRFRDRRSLGAIRPMLFAPLIGRVVASDGVWIGSFAFLVTLIEFAPVEDGKGQADREPY